MESLTIWKTTLFCSLSQVRKTTRSSGATKSTVLSTSARKPKHIGSLSEDASSTLALRPWKKTQPEYKLQEERDPKCIPFLPKITMHMGGFCDDEDGLFPDLGYGCSFCNYL